MIECLLHGKLFWVNLKNPTPSDIDEVAREFDLSPTLTNDLSAPVPKNYAVLLDGYIKIAVDFPVVKRIDKDHPYEVKFLVSKEGLITVQYEEMEAIDRFRKNFEVVTTLNRAAKHITGSHIFFALLGELYNACSQKLDYVESIMSDIEAEIFNDNERQMVFRIAQTSKKIIAFRHTLFTHEDVHVEARPLFECVFKNGCAKDFDNVENVFDILRHRTNALFDTLDALSDTNFAMLTAKQNEIMKTLTIMAFITFPLTLFTSTFGMNTQTTPIIGQHGDFWIIVGIMIMATICFFIFFKYKKWM